MKLLAAFGFFIFALIIRFVLVILGAAIIVADLNNVLENGPSLWPIAGILVGLWVAISPVSVSSK